MSIESFGKSRPSVAVFGATGHTGKMVVAELVRRKLRTVAIARSAEALEAARFPEEVLRRVATAEDAAALERALEGVDAVVNCAGPFLDTADAVATAAVKSRVHYLDVSAEQMSAAMTLEKFDGPASEAGVTIMPAMGFYGGFADLLATVALGDWKSADAIEVMIGLDSWHPTRGTRLTGARNTFPRKVIIAGALAPLAQPAPQKPWDFGDELGQQLMIELPFTEIALISQHVRTLELHTYLSAVALEDIRDTSTPPPQQDATGRSPQKFAVEVVARRGGESRRAAGRGQDIYAFTAPLVCEVVERLHALETRCAGAFAPGTILNARQILEALQPNHLALKITSA